jgi:putative membrane protein
MLVLAQIANSDLHGFLPTRGSFMLDFVFVALFAVVPILAGSILLVKFRGPNQGYKCEWHKRIQLALAVILLAAVAAFEIDMRFITKDWRSLAEASPYFASKIVDYSLWIHLCFAVPTPVLWIFVIVRALKRFPKPAAPCDYSSQHIFWGRIAAGAMMMTAVTGWTFYWLAFVA